MAQLVQERRSVLVAAHVDPAVHERLLEVARGEDRSLASVIRRSLDRELRSVHGTMRLLTVIDFAGTPLDPSDDQFVSQELVSSNGGKPQPDINYCDSFHVLTG